jgi:protein-disulfide isomerase
MEKQKVAMVFGATALVAIGIGAGLYWRGQAQQNAAGDQNGQSMIVERSRGDSAAPITIYEFSDFQCPYCRQFAQEILPALDREYLSTGKARLTFVNYPIPQLHPNAVTAHNFAMCVARQKQFWPVHDLLFRHQKQWEKLADPNSYFRKLADSVTLNRRDLAACMEGRLEDWLVQAEAHDAGASGISGTPAFVINGGLLPGMQPMEVWRPILDSIYRAARR